MYSPDRTREQVAPRPLRERTVTTDVIVSHVTLTSREVALHLKQQWRFLHVASGQVRVGKEPVASFDKRGGTVRLTPLASRDAVRWIAWAIQEICPDAEAIDEEADPPRITEAPMSAEEVQQVARSIVADRRAEIAREADPSGGGHEATALVTYLVEQEKLEIDGPIVPIVRAVVPLLQDVDESVGAKLEDVLLDLDEVGELYADADELTKVVMNNDHVFDR